jgi:hypothetical protein
MKIPEKGVLGDSVENGLFFISKPGGGDLKSTFSGFGVSLKSLFWKTV